jgi:hypothetical protein
MMWTGFTKYGYNHVQKMVITIVYTIPSVYSELVLTQRTGSGVDIEQLVGFMHSDRSEQTLNFTHSTQGRIKSLKAPQ